MSTLHKVSRRSVLIGGISVALVGCDPPSGGTYGDGGGSSSPQLSLPTWADVGLFLTMLTIGGPVAGALAGALRLPRLAAVIRTVSGWAEQGDRIYDAIEFANQLRSQRFALPALSSSPKPFIVPEDGSINDFESVPVFRNDVALQLGILNEEGGNFGEHDIYATVRRVDERPPQTYSDIFGSADLPHVIVTPASNGNWDRRIDMGRLPPGAYISYSWKVPRGQQPSDEYIASTGFIGPAFLAIDDASYSVDLADAIDEGRNVEARFQLPDASLA